MPDYPSKHQLACWFKRGVLQKDTYMLIVRDIYDQQHFPYFPIYVNCVTDFYRMHQLYTSGKNDGSVSEVYDLMKDQAEQLAEQRAYHPPKN